MPETLTPWAGLRRRLLALAGVGTLALGGCSTDSQGGEPSSSSMQDNGTARAVTWEDTLVDLAEMYGIDDPPKVEPIREITPAESKEVIDACLEQRGWPVVDGHITYVTDQEAALDLDSYICTASYPIREEYLNPLDEAGWGRVYDYWVNETLPCLRAEGIEVPDPPTRETFVERRDWTPDGDLVRDQVDEMVAAGRYPDYEHIFTQVCPVTPPPEVRLGR